VAKQLERGTGRGKPAGGRNCNAAGRTGSEDPEWTRGWKRSGAAAGSAAAEDVEGSGLVGLAYVLTLAGRPVPAQRQVVITWIESARGFLAVISASGILPTR